MDNSPIDKKITLLEILNISGNEIKGKLCGLCGKWSYRLLWAHYNNRMSRPVTDIFTRLLTYECQRELLIQKGFATFLDLDELKQITFLDDRIKQIKEILAIKFKKYEKTKRKYPKNRKSSKEARARNKALKESSEEIERP